MSALRAVAEKYLAIRRALGFKLKDPGRLVIQFVDYLEDVGATVITTDTGFGLAPASHHCQPLPPTTATCGGPRVCSLRPIDRPADGSPIEGVATDSAPTTGSLSVLPGRDRSVDGGRKIH